MRHSLFTLLFLAATALAAQERPTPFNPDSAAANLRTLSIDIGPRPMGSPNEQAAMRFAVDQFGRAGLDEAYILPFRVAPSERSTGSNTNSGTAVGILRGSSGRMIVIGAHIDSYSPEGPGANDDGSGSAVVIELARAMAQRDWESTIVFCLFGGEESGLKGSYHFVRSFPAIDSVVLMLQVDMANGSDWLLPMYDLRSTAAPEWLVTAAYEEFDRLQYSGLSYPTHFYTLNAAAGGASSDHEPFLRAGIPAIDFTTDVSDPIHTPQDSYENFRLGGLERSGDLVYRLAERFDGGVPEETEGSYMTIQIGRTPYLIPFWLLWVFNLGAVAAGVWALVTLRPARTEKRGETWATIPGLKILLVTFLVSLSAVLIEDVLAIVSGFRSPWFGDPSAMVPVVVSTAVFVLLVVSRFADRMDLSKDEYRYALRSSVTFLVLIILTSMVNPRLAAYPALGLLFTSLAYIAQRGLLACALILLGLYPTLRLVFSEVYDFIARSFALVPPGANAVAFSVILTLFGVLLLAPFMLALAGVVRSGSKTWPAFAFPYGHPLWLGLAAAAVVLFSAFVLSDEPYSSVWSQKVEVTQEVTDDGPLRTTVRSADYLDVAAISFMAMDTVVTSKEAVVVLPELPFNGRTWLRSETEQMGDAGMMLRISTWTRPYELEVRYSTQSRGDSTGITAASAGAAAVTVQGGQARIAYYSFPDTSILLPVTLSLTRSDTVKQTIVATFVEPAVPLTVSKDNIHVIHRTIVQETKRFYVRGMETVTAAPASEE